jgi:hypothetical protein
MKILERLFQSMAVSQLNFSFFKLKDLCGIMKPADGGVGHHANAW